MAGDAFDIVDSRNIGIRNARRTRGAFFADDLGGFGRDGADAAHFLGGQGLNLEPDSVAIGGGPDGFHLGAGIARDHGGTFRKSFRARRKSVARRIGHAFTPVMRAWQGPALARRDCNLVTFWLDAPLRRLNATGNDYARLVHTACPGSVH